MEAAREVFAQAPPSSSPRAKCQENNSQVFFKGAEKMREKRGTTKTKRNDYERGRVWGCRRGRSKRMAIRWRVNSMSMLTLYIF